MGINPAVVTDNKTFLMILETGHICGLQTVNEAIDNVLLHFNCYGGDKAIPECFPSEVQYAEKLISSSDLGTKQLLNSRIVDIVPKHTINKWEKDELEFFESHKPVIK